MKRLIALGLFLLAVACAPEAPPPAASAPPPPVAAAPPPPPPAPPPPTMVSFDGRYSGMATLGVSGANSESATNPICVDQRPMNMTVQNGYAVIVYHNWRRSTLHYRGRIDPTGKIDLSHLNRDGSRAVFTLQLDGNGGATGVMDRGNCSYNVSMTRA